MISIWLEALWNKLLGKAQEVEEEDVRDYSQVPKNLDAAVDWLIKENEGNKELESLLESESSFIGQVHFGCGMNMRNDWGFWDHENPSGLAKWFHARGIYHADDMSSIVLRTFYRRMKGEEEKVSEQIEDIRKYWRDQGQDPDRLFDPPKQEE